MELTPYYRRFDLAWEPDPEERGRLWKLLGGGLLLLLLLGVIVPLKDLEDVGHDRKGGNFFTGETS